MFLKYLECYIYTIKSEGHQPLVYLIFKRIDTSSDVLYILKGWTPKKNKEYKMPL